MSPSQSVPFTPPFSDAAVEDLRTRLRSARLPQPASDISDDEGVNPTWLQELLQYWAEEFDFDAYRTRLSKQGGQVTIVEGHEIHYLHASPQADLTATPLLLAHGWPDSAWRYRTVAPLLAAGTPAFDVVVPDMPGFGWSPAGDTALNSRQVAALWADLMTSLGHEQFMVAGGDIGSHVARYLALDFPDRVLGVHRMDAGLPYYGGDPADLTPPERDWMAASVAWGYTEAGYAAMHSTKPATLAVGLTDSPAGLAAWVGEKLVSWSDCGGDPWTVYSREDVLDLLSDFWFSGNIGASVRMYRANAAIPRAQLDRYVTTPSGFSIFSGDITHPPREWVARTTHLVSFTTPARGGHFAPREQPALYATELQDFARLNIA
ncbi:MAG: epoxide hydrolase [Cellulomonadaceae bacterium]|nr:epoxide hydrolase [Cellulomonadaceae bacterium]